MAELADAIVGTARATLEATIDFINSSAEWRARVVYGDTDSVFVHLPGRTREEAFRVGAAIARAVTARNPAPVKLKFEKVRRRLRRLLCDTCSCRGESRPSAADAVDQPPRSAALLDREHARDSTACGCSGCHPHPALWPATACRTHHVHHSSPGSPGLPQHAARSARST